MNLNIDRLHRLYHLRLLPFLCSLPPLLSRLLLIFLLQFRDRAYMVLLVSVGVSVVARNLKPSPSFAWGCGMVVFGALSLVLRKRDQP